MSPSEDSRQGRAQFVRYRREKLVLKTISLFRFLACGFLAGEEFGPVVKLRLKLVFPCNALGNVLDDREGADYGPVMHQRGNSRNLLHVIE